MQQPDTLLSKKRKTRALSRKPACRHLRLGFSSVALLPWGPGKSLWRRLDPTLSELGASLGATIETLSRHCQVENHCSLPGGSFLLERYPE